MLRIAGRWVLFGIGVNEEAMRYRMERDRVVVMIQGASLSGFFLLIPVVARCNIRIAMVAVPHRLK